MFRETEEAKIRMKHVGIVAVAIAMMYVAVGNVHAEYVLPYPSAMPGNKVYRISRLIDRLKRPFYFGSIGSYKYHLMLSDKYLVEAKTLFEYKQYLLAQDALHRSDAEFAEVPKFLTSAKAEGKDMRNFARQLAEAAGAHQSVLIKLKADLPDLFRWTPEKAEAVDIPIADLLGQSIHLREMIRASVQRL